MTREEFFAAKNKGALWDVGVSINRTNPLPLDKNAVFDTYENALAYAKGVLAYPGQFIAVVGEDAVTGYLITVAGGEGATLVKLAQTSGSGDVNEQLNALSTKVNSIVTEIGKASTDDTADWLDKWKNENHKFFVEIIHSKENLGGSGGFYLGQQQAMELDVDWILIADDDAYLPENYISGLYEYIVTHDTEDVSVLCGLVEEHNSYDNKHRMILKKNTCQFDFFEKLFCYILDKLSSNTYLSIERAFYFLEQFITFYNKFLVFTFKVSFFFTSLAD